MPQPRPFEAAPPCLAESVEKAELAPVVRQAPGEWFMAMIMRDHDLLRAEVYPSERLAELAVEAMREEHLGGLSDEEYCEQSGECILLAAYAIYFGGVAAASEAMVLEERIKKARAENRARREEES
jgi:hypothetical protein